MNQVVLVVWQWGVPIRPAIAELSDVSLPKMKLSKTLM